MKPRQFIVVFSNDDFTVPFTWDNECEGAICGWLGGNVAVFDSRADARKAIKISTAFARLCQAQGRPVNIDFIDDAKCLKIVPLEAKGGDK